MDGIKNARALVDPWWTYLNYCFSQNPFSPVCESFWERIVLARIVLGVIAVLAGVMKFFSYRRKFEAALRAQAERDAIDDGAFVLRSGMVTRRTRQIFPARRSSDEYAMGSSSADETRTLPARGKLKYLEQAHAARLGVPYLAQCFGAVDRFKRRRDGSALLPRSKLHRIAGQVHDARLNEQPSLESKPQHPGAEWGYEPP